MDQQRWNYRVMEFKGNLFGKVDHKKLQAEMDKLGAQGWELVSTNRGFDTPMTLFFKRPC